MKNTESNKREIQPMTILKGTCLAIETVTTQ